MSSSLDFALSSTYDHSMETFPNKIDVVLQPQTVQSAVSEKLHLRDIRSQDRQHPLRYGGVQDKKHPSSIKNGISSFHTPQTNAGFARKVDGSFFSV